MAESDLETTLDQSKLSDTEDQTDVAVDNSADDSDGNASDDSKVEDTEEVVKPRGERKHERYIDKLTKEIQEFNARDDTSLARDLFPTDNKYQPVEYTEDSEYDPKVLEEDRLNFGKNKFSEGLHTGFQQGSQQAITRDWETKFDIDGERVSAKYEKQLANPDLEADLVQDYIAFIGMTKDEKTGRISIQKPNIRFKDFADADFSKKERYAALKQSESKENISKQASNTGVRPNGQSRPSSGGHGFDDSSDEAAARSVDKMTRKQYFELGGKEASDTYLAKKHTN